MGQTNIARRTRRIFIQIFTAGALLLSVSCGKPLADHDVDPYYITGSKENREQFIELFNILGQEEDNAQNEFAVVREIAASYARLNDYTRLIHFLCDRTINYPDDPYNGYYLLMVAYAYIQLDSYPIAAKYFELIIKNYPDLTINGESIHLICLKQLIGLTDNAERQVWYYQELISRFPDSIELGFIYFMLGQACERIGDWNGAIQAYTQYLPYTGTPIPGFPNADQYARQQVDYSRSSKDWTFESLPALLRHVEAALDSGSYVQLRRAQAKVNFFARTWEQGETDDYGMADFNLSDLMRGRRIRYASSLDASSNASEAFLRTSGWSNISTWFLYFRKIYFPSDPEIHGRWEWAGIYYGEKF
jgi:tetratricopeptide (TPR) repeat protein